MKSKSSDAARLLASLRRVHAGGRPPIAASCPKCGTACASVRLARAHCAGRKKKRKIGLKRK